uniref:Uncharacterized protein n=1 Tax=Ditylenchus dipsaci TaxID=166011 RepID=A0A915CQZ8_9BILA
MVSFDVFIIHVLLLLTPANTLPIQQKDLQKRDVVGLAGDLLDNTVGTEGSADIIDAGIQLTNNTDVKKAVKQADRSLNTMDRLDEATDDLIEASDNWGDEAENWMEDSEDWQPEDLDDDNFWEDNFETDYDQNGGGEDYGDEDYDGEEDYDEDYGNDYGRDDYGSDSEDPDFDIDDGADAVGDLGDTAADLTGETVESVVGAGEGIAKASSSDPGIQSNPFWLRYVSVPPRKYIIWTVDINLMHMEMFNLTYLVGNQWKSVVKECKKFYCPSFANIDADSCYGVGESVDMAEISYKSVNQSWSSAGLVIFEERFFSRHHPSSHTNQTDHQLLLSLKSELGQMVHEMQVISQTDHAENQWTRLFNLIISAIELLLLGLGPAFVGLIAALNMAAKRRLRRINTHEEALADDWPTHTDYTATIDTTITQGPQMDNNHSEIETGTLISGLGRHEDQ